MRSYEAARSLFSFLAFCAWSVVIIGVLVALVAGEGGSRYGGGAGLLAMVPGIGFGLAGLLLVAFVQMGRATVDTAEYTQQMLKVARDQLEVSKQALNQGSAVGKSFVGITEKSKPSSRHSTHGGHAAELNSVDQPVSSIEREISHQVHTIPEIEERFHVDGKDFASVEHAKNYVENILPPQDDKLLAKKTDS